jgi:CO/xanthine dehydrogenase FAD-binding subunit
VRAQPAAYELVAPGSLSAVLQLLAEQPSAWTPIAGGTDLMVLYSAGKLQARRLVSIDRIPELRAIQVGGGEIHIGAACTYTELRQNPIIAQEFPLLVRSAAWTGGIANQNRGTLGGNIANASPAGDSLPVLLVYDADLILVSSKGQRRIPYRTFHTGYKKSILAPDELIQSICLRREFAGYASYGRKVGARNAQAISKVFLAALCRVNGDILQDIRLAAGSVGPIPVRLFKTEQALTGQLIGEPALKSACAILEQEIQPIDDIRSSARYRTVVLCNLLREFLQTLPQASSQT